MRFLPIFASLTLVACETDLYRWNLAHAYVTPQTHLSRGDFEQIVQIVTHATGQPILGISPLPSSGRQLRVSVDTGNGSPQSLELRKDGSTWRITLKGGVVE